MYGPLCWQGCDNDQGGFKKLMWYVKMKEFNCKVTSSWSTYGRESEMAFTHRQFGNEGEEGRRSWIISSDPGGHQMRLWFTMMSRRGVLGTIVQ